MNKNALSVIAVLVLLAAGAWYVSTYVSQKPLSADEDTAVRALVMEFGTKLQFVPLLAVEAERKTTMELYYGPYVAPELIAEWTPEGTQEALGRYSSSPTPERIEVVSVLKKTPNTFVVEGNVIEVAVNAAGNERAVAAVYPVTLALERRDGKLLIVKSQKGAYSQIPQRVSLTGYWECVPVKASEPQTEECMRGIAIEASDGHVIVNTMLMSRSPVEYEPRTKVRVEGVLVPANQLSSDQWQKYDIDGVISATVIEEVE